MPSIFGQWDLAWVEFGSEHPRMKRLSIWVAFLIFTVLGQSILSLVQMIYPFLPWIAWPLMFLVTLVLTQVFVIHFSAVAHHRTSREASEGFDRILKKERLQAESLLNEERSHAKSLQSQLDKKNKQDLSIKQERVVLEKNQAPSGTLSLIDWYVTIFLYITNRHEFDNAIREYGLTVTLPDGKDLKGKLQSIGALVSRSAGDVADLSRSLDEPLKRGHPRKGAVRFCISSTDLDLNLTGLDYVLRIQDAYDVAHKTSGVLPKPSDEFHWKIPDSAFGG